MSQHYPNGAALDLLRATDRIRPGSPAAAVLLEQSEESTRPTLPFELVQKTRLPDRQRQVDRATEFFGRFLQANEHAENLGGRCYMNMVSHQRGWRGTIGQMKLLRPSANAGMRAKIQPEGSGDCTLHAVIFPNAQGTENDVYEMLIAGNGGSSTWPNTEPGQRPENLDGESTPKVINRTKLRKLFNDVPQDLEELISALDLFVSEGTRRVTALVMEEALKEALNLTMRNEADYHYIIKWMWEAEYLTRDNGEYYVLPEIESTGDEVAEPEEPEELSAEHIETSIATPTATEPDESTEAPANVSVPELAAEPIAPPTTSVAGAMSELASFERLAEEHRAHQALLKELTEKQVELATLDTELKDQIAELRRQQTELQKQRGDVEQQIADIHKAGARFKEVADRVRALHALFTTE